MKKYIILIGIVAAFMFNMSRTTAQPWEIKIAGHQDPSDLHVMLTENNPGKYRYGRGKWFTFYDFMEIVADSLAAHGVGGGADGNGIYGGPGTVPAGTVATLTDFLRFYGVGINPYLNIHSSTGSNSAFMYFSNATTGNTTSDGFYVGLTSFEVGHINQRENNSIVISTNNTSRYLIDGNGDATYTTLPDVVTSPKGFVSIDTTTGAVSMYKQPFRVYTALLTQTDTDAPIATVLENTLGGTVVWTRVDAGVYVGTLTGAFTAKTFILNWYTYQQVDDVSYEIERISSNEIGINTQANAAPGSWIGADSWLNTFPVQIKVYN